MHTSPDLLALLALGELVGTEEDLVHIAGCPSCRTELSTLTAAARTARKVDQDDVLVRPRPQVWDQISRELHLQTVPPVETVPAAPATPSSATVAPAAPLTAVSAASSTSSARTQRNTRLAAFALAAVLALVVGIGLGANVERILPGSREVASVDLNALPAWAGADGRAVVETDRDGNRYLLVQAQVPQSRPGLREVWLTNSAASTMYAMGYLDDGQGRFVIPPELNLTEFRLVDVSLEPLGDKDFRHSGDSMLRGKLPA